MSSDDATRTLHHDLRDALSAVHMNLQTLDVLETGEAEVTPEKRRTILSRAKKALAEAVAVADRLRAREPDHGPASAD